MDRDLLSTYDIVVALQHTVGYNIDTGYNIDVCRVNFLTVFFPLILSYCGANITRTERAGRVSIRWEVS